MLLNSLEEGAWYRRRPVGGHESRAHDIVIRPYDPVPDFDGMFAVAREILGSLIEADAQRELREYPRKRARADVAVTPSGRIVGFCGTTFPYWHRIGMIDYLVVAPDRRDQGIGARLVQGTEHALREAGARRLCVQTVAWNEGGIRFYERLGYREIARLPRYFHDEDERRWDLVWLDRSLG